MDEITDAAKTPARMSVRGAFELLSGLGQTAEAEEAVGGALWRDFGNWIHGHGHERSGDSLAAFLDLIEADLTEQELEALLDLLDGP